MIYLDNAATTYPKPPSVINAVTRCMNEYGGNAGRGSHKLAMLAAECVYDCRARVAGMFGAEDPSRVVFTLNTTYALNTAIKSMAQSGDHFLIGNFEHNAVRRPLERLKREGIVEYDVFDIRGRAGAVICRLQRLVRPTTRAIVCAHMSNICNIKAPIREIGEFCRRQGIIFIVDAAQSAGILDIDLRNDFIDYLCIPGHKGLYGPQGCGIMIANGRFPNGKTLAEGGSGMHSLDADMPSDLPERFEAGTLPTPAIAGLCEGINFVQMRGVRSIHEHECALWWRLYSDMRSMRGVRIYEDTPGAILLFNVDGFTPAQIGSELNRVGICVRSGLHCAPMAHEVLGTGSDGAVRVSLGAMNTVQEMNTFVDSLYATIRS